jgi:hypothetical protein
MVFKILEFDVRILFVCIITICIFVSVCNMFFLDLYLAHLGEAAASPR